MHKLLSAAMVGLVCATFGPAASPIAAAAGAGAFHSGVGGFHAFHGGFRGFNRGLYPYTLFGYPGYKYGGYFPYSVYEDDGPDCRFEWPKRTAKQKAAKRGVWTCS
jgi:hypothetical protein